MKATPTKFSPLRFVRLLWQAPLAHREAVRLAQVLWRRSYRKASPYWKPLDDTVGVISQIDNMHAGVAQELEEVRMKYDQLIYAVASKHDNETRHETALRYILERESPRAECPFCGASRASQKR